MKCPKCNADSSVLATRAYKVVLTQRMRVCFNEHRFTTYEVHAGQLDRRTLETVGRGAEARARANGVRRAVVANPALSAGALAARAGVTEARVRQIRASIAREMSSPKESS